MTDILVEKMEYRSPWNDMLNMLKSMSTLNSIFNENAFKQEDNSQRFYDKQNLRRRITSTSTLQEILRNFFRQKKKDTKLKLRSTGMNEDHWEW